MITKLLFYIILSTWMTEMNDVAGNHENALKKKKKKKIDATVIITELREKVLKKIHFLFPKKQQSN